MERSQQAVPVRINARWLEIRTSGAVSAIVTAVVGLSCLIYGVGRGLTNWSFDLPFAFRPSITPTNAVIVYMDEESHRALNQPYFAAWDRRIHAQLLDRLKSAGVKAVAFDVLFDSTTTNDLIFAKAIQAHGRVVLAARYTPLGVSGDSYLWEPKQPIEELRKYAAWGVAESPDEDDVVRQHYSASRHSTNLLSLAWRTAETSGIQHLPSPFGLRYLNYYGPPGAIPWCSYVDVLSNNVPVAMLSNKVVFVGARVGTGYSGTKGTDNFPTPYTRQTGGKAAGVEINATAFLNLARGDWLIRLSPVNELLVVMGTAVLFGFGLMLFRPLAVSLIAATAMVLGLAVACAVLWQQRVWFPWAIVSGLQIPCAAICAMLWRTQRLYREKHSLEQRLQSSDRVNTYPQTKGSSPNASLAQPNTTELVRQTLNQKLNIHPAPVAEAAVAGAPVIPDCLLLRRIGAGAYGEVWLGKSVIGAFRAIKVVRRDRFQEERPYAREFDGIRHFDPVSRTHPGLVQVLHVGRNDAAGFFYYVMELADDVDGRHPIVPEKYQPKNLAGELEKRGRFTAEQCLELGINLADALGYLHEHRLIHRDIKPSNIIFVAGKPKLADIGLITPMGGGRTLVGTEGFFPPEGPGSPASDVYSLGKVLYVTLTGMRQDQFPELPSEIGKGVNVLLWRRLNGIVLRACEGNAQKRYTSAQHLRDDLIQAGGGPAARQKQAREPRQAPPPP